MRSSHTGEARAADQPAIGRNRSPEPAALCAVGLFVVAQIMIPQDPVAALSGQVNGRFFSRGLARTRAALPGCWIQLAAGRLFCQRALVRERAPSVLALRLDAASDGSQPIHTGLDGARLCRATCDGRAELPAERRASAELTRTSPK